MANHWASKVHYFCDQHNRLPVLLFFDSAQKNSTLKRMFVVSSQDETAWKSFLSFVRLDRILTSLQVYRTFNLSRLKVYKFFELDSF